MSMQAKKGDLKSGHWHGSVHDGTSHRVVRRESHAERSSGRVVDPVCGMTVEPTTAKYRTDRDGASYYFCSSDCQSKFMTEPNRYLKPSRSAPPARAGIIYTCPMHPQIRRTAPGSCPICGMALEPVGATEESGPSPELINMTRRFWIGTVLAVPTVILEMGAHLPGLNFHRYVSPQLTVWLQFLLATPVILAAGALKLGDLTGPLGEGVRGQVLFGSLMSGICAYLSVRFLTRYFANRSLRPFGAYCLIAGGACLVWFTVR